MSFNKIHKIIFPCIIAGGILICNLNAGATMQYYKQGVQSDDVKKIQNELKKLGFFNGESTGYYGQLTKNAVIEYQKTNGFVVDGIVGPGTWNVLIGTSNTAQLSAETVNSTPDLKGVLKLESEGEEVKKLQLKLKEIGYFNENATGYFGQVTEDAVKKYQSADGALADGIVGQATWESLFGTSENSVSTSNSNILLKNGDRSDDVKKAQQKLKELGYFKVNATGVYGSITVLSVKNYQLANGLKADGVIGSATWDKIFSGTSVSANTRNTVSRGTSLRDAVAVENGLISWNQVSSIFKLGSIATVIDVKTGKQFQIKRTYGTNHADVEPASADDTYIMKQIYGGSWSWARRPIVVIVGDQKFAASMNGMPHAGLDYVSANATVSGRSAGYGRGINYDAVKGNNMDGHICVHFLNSTTHSTGRVDAEHQAAIKSAAKYLENN